MDSSTGAAHVTKTCTPLAASASADCSLNRRRSCSTCTTPRGPSQRKACRPRKREIAFGRRELEDRCWKFQHEAIHRARTVAPDEREVRANATCERSACKP
jgi:Flp pilus assembly protein TadD